MKKRLKKKSGFTLIEIMIVISIIVVLAAIAVPKYASIQKDAKVRADISSAKVIGDATVALLAQEKITNDNYNGEGVELNDDDEITSYLQTLPVVKAVDGKFNVTIDTSDNVVIKIVSTDPVGSFELYPIPDNKYPNVEPVETPDED